MVKNDALSVRIISDPSTERFYREIKNVVLCALALIETTDGSIYILSQLYTVRCAGKSSCYASNK